MKFPAFRKFWNMPAVQVLARKFLAATRTKKVSCPPALSAPYGKWAYRNRLTSKMTAFMVSCLAEHDPGPVFSIVIPVFNTPEDLLRKTLKSVTGQIYPRWEACVVDDGSDLPHVQKMLDEFANNDPRFRIGRNASNEGVPAAANKAVSMGTGDYVVFLDSDDLLEPDALAQLAWFVINNPDADLIYTDNDTIGTDGIPLAGQFKPGFSPDLFRSIAFYFNHLVIYRRKFLETIGFYQNFRCSHDYDLADRAISSGATVAHIPLVLYHWRDRPGSISKAKVTCIREILEIIRNSLSRSVITWARAVPAPFPERDCVAIFRFVPAGTFEEKISIVITDVAGSESVLRCIGALFSRTRHTNREVIVITSKNRAGRIKENLASRLPGTAVSFVTYDPSGQETVASMKNLAARRAIGDFILFIDSQLIVDSDQYLEQLLIQAKFPGTGITGGRIHDNHGRIIDAGAVFTGIPQQPVLHLYREGYLEDHGYMNILDVPKNYSLVSGSFCIVNRQVFDRLGGFDADMFPDAFSDYDFCLRAVTGGFRVVSLPSVTLTLAGILSGAEPGDRTGEFRSSLAFFERWRHYTDPYYNPNLTRDEGHSYEAAPGLNSRLALFPPQKKPLKILSVSHELRTGGAPRVKFQVDSALHRMPGIWLDVLCTQQDDGAMRQEYLREDIPVTLLSGYWNVPFEEYCRFSERVKEIMRTGSYDVVYANTLNCFWAVEAAYELGIPTVWNIHEYYDPDIYFDMIIPDPRVKAVAKSSLVHANRLVFVSKAMQALFRGYDCFGTSDCIYTGIDCGKVDRYLEIDKEALRSELGLPQRKKIISVIGTITERKGQLDLVEAARDLLATRDDLVFLIIGDYRRDEDSHRYYEAIMKRWGSDDRIRIIASPPDVYRYYRVTDIFVCTSRIESFALVVQEAMAFSLPVVTTTIPGILEQLGHGVTGLTYDPGDIKTLAAHLRTLLSDEKYAGMLGHNAGMFIRTAFREHDMTDRYYRIIRTVAMEDVNFRIG